MNEHLVKSIILGIVLSGANATASNIDINNGPTESVLTQIKDNKTISLESFTLKEIANKDYIIKVYGNEFKEVYRDTPKYLKGAITYKALESELVNQKQMEYIRINSKSFSKIDIISLYKKIQSISNKDNNELDLSGVTTVINTPSKSFLNKYRLENFKNLDNDKSVSAINKILNIYSLSNYPEKIHLLKALKESIKGITLSMEQKENILHLKPYNKNIVNIELINSFNEMLCNNKAFKEDIFSDLKKEKDILIKILTNLNLYNSKSGVITENEKFLIREYLITQSDKLKDIDLSQYLIQKEYLKNLITN